MESTCCIATDRVSSDKREKGSSDREDEERVHIYKVFAL